MKPQAPATKDKTGGSRGIVLKLAWADLLHEWVLSLCLVLAVAAVVAPLLLLFGLKSGTIETLRFRLVQNPVNREVRPTSSHSFSREYIANLNRMPQVSLAIPATRQLSSTVVGKVLNGKQKVSLDVVPTAAGDALLLENGSKVPGDAECVLTASAAKKINAKPGDNLVFNTSRYRGGVYETGTFQLKLVGVASPRASFQDKLFVTLGVLEAVEKYKDGQAVARFNWSGSVPKAYEQFDGAVLVCEKPLARSELIMLKINTGFYGIEEIDHDPLLEKTGLAFKKSLKAYFLSTFQGKANGKATRNTPVGNRNLRAIENKLRGKRYWLFPWVKPIKAELINKAGKRVATNIYTLGKIGGLAEGSGLEPNPPWRTDKGSLQDYFRISLPEGLAKPGKGYRLKLVDSENPLELPVEVIGENSARKGVAFVPPELAGRLRLNRDRPLLFDKQSGKLVVTRRGYASFRLYAKTIDQVEWLKEFFEKQGLKVHTKSAEIRQVLELDLYLTLVFWLIAMVGIAGGGASLIASLYASVERKKRELSVLRLIGLSRSTLLRYPVYQGLSLALNGFLLATGFFVALAYAINTLFAEHLREGESFCRLPLEDWLAALGGTLLIAVLAAALAAWRVGKIEPAEALRDE